MDCFACDIEGLLFALYLRLIEYNYLMAVNEMQLNSWFDSKQLNIEKAIERN